MYGSAWNIYIGYIGTGTASEGTRLQFGGVSYVYHKYQVTPAGVYLFPNPRQRFALRIWPGTIQVSRSR